VLLQWEKAFELVTVLTDGCYPLLEKSTIRCAVGGEVSILDTLQIAVPTPPHPARAEESRAALLALAPLLLQRDADDTETLNDDEL
jgi:hypothetical protein